MSKYFKVQISVNVDGKTTIYDVKMEEGMHFRNNGDTYSIKEDGSIWNSAGVEVDSIKMTKYQYNIFQALANNVQEEGESGCVLSSEDINDAENGALKKWSLGQFGEDMSVFIDKEYIVKGTHHHKNSNGQVDGVEMDVLKKADSKWTATLTFWFDKVSKKAQPKSNKAQQDTITQNAQAKVDSTASDESQEGLLTKVYNFMRRIFSGQPAKPVEDSYPDGVEEIPSCEYVIKKGDTVITIANKCGVSKERLMHVNSQLDTNMIFAGQKINIPKRYSVENTEVSTKEDVAKYSNLSTDYINFLMFFERMHSTPYNDKVGKGTLTVGYGHTNRLLGKYYKGCKEADLDKRIEMNSKNSDKIKLANKDAYQILAQDLINHREDAILYFGDSFLRAPLSIQEAIVDIIFNKGIKKGLEGIGDDGKPFETPTKEIKKYLDKGNYEEVAKHVIYGTENKGLQKRNICRVMLACRDLDEKTRQKVLNSCHKYYENVMSQYSDDAEILAIKQQWNKSKKAENIEIC